MTLIPDDPIISCAMRTGYPPWMSAYDSEAEDEEEREAMVCMTDDGMIYCEECEGIIPCDLFTNLPEYCPHCDARLNYKRVYTRFMKGMLLV